MLSPLIQIPCALFLTGGFCLIYNVPLKKCSVCMAVGAVTWMSYQAVIQLNGSQVLAAFIGSCIVWLLSNISSRIFKETSTMFIIPGIICLVPGAGTYYTMLAVLNNDMESFASEGTLTLMTAGAIAAGLLAMGSVTGVIVKFINRIKSICTKKS